MINGSLSIEKLVELQSLIQRCFPDSDLVIAGGCLRDLLHGVQVKDIDVFVSLPGGSTGGWLEDVDYPEYNKGKDTLAKALFSTVEEDFKSAKTYSSFRVLSYPEGFRMYPVQLIFVEELPIDNLKKDFDFGLCQVWLDRGKLQMTSDYWRDHNSQTFHLLPPEGKAMPWTIEVSSSTSRKLVSPKPGRQELKLSGVNRPTPRRCSAERIKKLQAKYPGWRFQGVDKLLREVVTAESLVEVKKKVGNYDLDLNTQGTVTGRLSCRSKHWGNH